MLSKGVSGSHGDNITEYVFSVLILSPWISRSIFARGTKCLLASKAQCKVMPAVISLQFHFYF